MSVFDQRGQHVTTQQNFNVSGNINFGAIYDKAAFIEELKKLRAELDITISQNFPNDETALAASSELQKTIQEAEKKSPDKSMLLDHIINARKLVSSISELAVVLGQAYEKIKVVF